MSDDGHLVLYLRLFLLKSVLSLRASSCLSVFLAGLGSSACRCHLRMLFSSNFCEIIDGHPPSAYT